MPKDTTARTDWKETATNTGWRVFPILIEHNGEKYDKRPLVKDWPNVTRDQIDSMPWDDANGFGIVTGGAGGLYALDVDDYKQGSEGDAWLAEYGLDGPTRTHQTVSGGTHRLYTLPPTVSLRSRNGIVHGLDGRGDGGFIAYGEGYSVLDDSDYVMLPAGACAEVDRVPDVRGIKTDHVEFHLVDLTDDLRQRVEALGIQDALGPVEGADRSKSLFRVATALKRTGFTAAEYTTVVYQMSADPLAHIASKKTEKAQHRALMKAWDDSGLSLAEIAAKMPSAADAMASLPPGSILTPKEAVVMDDMGDVLRVLQVMEPMALDDRIVIDPREMQRNVSAVLSKYFTWGGKPTLVSWQGQFYRWNESHWEPSEDGWVDDVLSHVFNKIFCFEKEKKEDGEVTYVRHPIGATIPFIKNHIAAMQAITRRPRAKEVGWSDHRPGTWQAVQNGILDLDTGKLVPHTPDFFNLTWLDAPWEPDAILTGTHMENYLRDMLDTVDQVALMQEIFGYVLSGDTSLQKAFMIIGPPRSGKGTLMRLWKTLLGGMVASIKSNQLQDKFALEGSIGKTLLLVPDVRLSKDSDFTAIAEMILTVTGEDDVDVRRMNKTSWQGRTTIRMVLSSNSVPMLRDNDGVLASRFVYVQCPNSFSGKENTMLLDNLLAERGAILRWAVAGWQRLKANRRFSETVVHKKVLDDALVRMDPVGAFMKAYVNVTGNADDFLPTDGLYGMFQMFSASYEITGFTKDGFSKQVNSKPLKLQRAVRSNGTMRGYSGAKWVGQ